MMVSLDILLMILALVLSDGKVSLKKDHAYMYKVQTQLLLCDADYVDFVVWTKNDFHFERVERDNDILDEIRQK